MNIDRNNSNRDEDINIIGKIFIIVILDIDMRIYIWSHISIVYFNLLYYCDIIYL